MNSNSKVSWPREIRAVFRKELTTEWRTKSGLFTAGLFGVAAVTAPALALAGQNVGGGLESATLWVVLLFAASVSLPRTFLAEEEQGTGDLLRLTARPHAVFWGKALYNLMQMLVTGLILAGLFSLFIESELRHVGLYFATLATGCAALAVTTTLCGALAAQAANRWTLAAAVALPLLLPVVSLGVSAMRVAFGDGPIHAGAQGCAGLTCFAIAGFALGPYLFAAVWRN